MSGTPHIPRPRDWPEPGYRGRICGHTCDLWVESALSCERLDCLLCPAGFPCHWDERAWRRPSPLESLTADAAELARFAWEMAADLLTRAPGLLTRAWRRWRDDPRPIWRGR